MMWRHSDLGRINFSVRRIQCICAVALIIACGGQEALAQDPLAELATGYFGQSKSKIRADLEKLKANLSEGITEEGNTFIMDEDSNDLHSWIFDDNQICIGEYLLFRTENGKKVIMWIRDEVGKRGTKIENNHYQFNNTHFRFESKSDGALAVLLQKK